MDPNIPALPMAAGSTSSASKQPTASPIDTLISHVKDKGKQEIVRASFSALQAKPSDTRGNFENFLKDLSENLPEGADKKAVQSINSKLGNFFPIGDSLDLQQFYTICSDQISSDETLQLQSHLNDLLLPTPTQTKTNLSGALKLIEATVPSKSGSSGGSSKFKQALQTLNDSFSSTDTSKPDTNKKMPKDMKAYSKLFESLAQNNFRGSKISFASIESSSESKSKAKIFIKKFLLFFLSVLSLTIAFPMASIASVCVLSCGVVAGKNLIENEDRLNPSSSPSPDLPKFKELSQTSDDVEKEAKQKAAKKKRMAELNREKLKAGMKEALVKKEADGSSQKPPAAG